MKKMEACVSSHTAGPYLEQMAWVWLCDSLSGLARTILALSTTKRLLVW